MENDVINATNKDKDGQVGTFGSFKKSGLCLVIKEAELCKIGDWKSATKSLHWCNSVNSIFVKK